MKQVQSSVDKREIEWQFDAMDTAPVVRWLAQHAKGDGLTAKPDRVRQLVDTYFDTVDWRFHRAGYSIRVRRWGRRFEASLKAFGEAENGKRDRREFTQPLSKLEELRTASGAVADRMRALAGEQELIPLFTITTSRKPYNVADNGQVVGEVVVDESLVASCDGSQRQRIQRVEVEVEDAEYAGVRAWVEDLRESCGLRVAGLAKYHVGLSVVGLHPAPLPEFGSLAIAKDGTIGEVASAVLRKHLGSLLAHEAGARLGDDPEDLHDMRVATRRLRAALSLFSDILALRAQRVREELRWLGHALGEVRDLDVQIEQLHAWRDESAERQKDLTPLHAVLERQRNEARQRMLAVLDSDRYRKLVGSITSMFDRGPVPVIDAGQVPVLEAAPDLLTKRYRRFRKAGDAITPASPSEEFHELRKRGKRLRYALEFFGDVYGKSTKEMVAPLITMQDILGAHQDAYVAVARLRELSTTEGDQLPSSTAFAMGEIAERYAQQTAELRSQFPDAYQALQGRRWQRLRRRMKEGRP